MPLVKVRDDLPLFEVPEGASQDQIIAAVHRSGVLTPQPSDSVTQPNTLIGRPLGQEQRGDFSRGVESGVDQLQGSLYGLAALLGDAAGSDDLRDWGLAGHERNQQEAARVAPRVGQFADVGSFSDFLDYSQGLLGNTTPFMATTIVGGGGGAVLSRAVAKKAVDKMVAGGVEKALAEKTVAKTMANKVMGPKIAALIGSGGASALSQQGELYASLKQQGIDDAVAPAVMYGALQGVADVLPEFRILGKLTGGLTAKAVEKQLSDSLERGFKAAAKDTLKGMGKQAAFEGLTEGAQEALGITARIHAGGEDLTEEDRNNVLESMAAGAIVGSVIGAPTEIASRLRTGSGKAKAPAQEGAARADGDGRARPSAGPAPGAGDVTGQPTGQTPVTPSPPTQNAPVTDAPTAEPESHLVAQLRDTRNRQNPRRGTYLSAANLAAHPDFIERHGNNLAVIPNADGNGGKLLAKPADANEFQARLRAGESREQLLGEFTLSGDGKPQTDNPVVVQQKDKTGAVTRESVVDGNDQAAVAGAAAAMEMPGRTVEAIDPATALQRRQTYDSPDHGPNTPVGTDPYDMADPTYQNVTVYPNEADPAKRVVRTPVPDQPTPGSEAMDDWRTQQAAGPWGGIDIARLNKESSEWNAANEDVVLPSERDQRAIKRIVFKLTPETVSDKTEVLPAEIEKQVREYMTSRGYAFDTPEFKTAVRFATAEVARRVNKLQTDTVFAEDAVDQWDNEVKEPRRNDFDAAPRLLGDLETERPTGFYGQHDQLHGSRVPGKGSISDETVTARPYTGDNAQAKAMEAADRLSKSDPDTTYVPHFAASIDEAHANGLSVPGWYVAAHRRNDTETFGPNRRSRAQAIRLTITRGKRAWQNLSREQKNPAPGQPEWGIEMLQLDTDGRPVLDANGDPKTVYITTKELVQLGRELTRENDSDRAANLVNALHEGVGALMSMDGDTRFVPAAYITGGKLSPHLVLAERGSRKLLLGQMGRNLEETARAANLSATLYGNMVRAGKIDDTSIPEVQETTSDWGAATDETRLEQQRTQRQLSDFPENSPERQQQFAKSNLNAWGRESTDRRPGTPVFEVRGTKMPTETLTEFGERAGDNRSVGDTEAAQNAASTTLRPVLNEGETRAAGDSQREGTSAIGSITAEQQPQRDQVAAPVIVKFSGATARSVRWTNVMSSLRDVFGLDHSIYMTDNITALAEEAGRDGADPWLAHLTEQAELIAAQKSGDKFVPGFMFQHGNRTYIFVHPQLTKTSGYESHLMKTVLHETGHAVFRQYIHRAPAGMQTELREAFYAARDRGDRTANRTKHSSGSALSEAAQFEEWMADQVAAWSARNEAPRNAVEQWFKGLADMFKEIWRKITGKYELDATADKWMRDVVMNTDRRTHPQLSSLGGANDLMFDAMEPMISKSRVVFDRIKAFKTKHRTLNAALDATTHAAKAIHETLISRLYARVHRMNIPAFSEMMRMFYLRAGEKGGFTYDSAVANRMRNFSQQYREIANRFPKDREDEVLQALQSEQDLTTIKDEKIRESVAQVRVFLRKLYDYQRAMNLPISEVQNYFPQVGDVAELLQPDAVDTIYRAVQEATAQMTPQQISAAEILTTRESIEELVSNMTEDNLVIDFDPNAGALNVGNSVKSPFNQAMIARRLSPAMRNIIRSVRDADGKARFYSKSVDHVMHNYMTQAVKRAEFNMLLGDRTWNADTANTPEGQTPRRFDPLARFHELILDARRQGATPQQIQFMYSSMSALTGRYNRIQDPNIRDIVKSVAFYQQLRTLLLTTLSSIPEFATLFLRTGDFGSTWASIRASAKDSLTKGSSTMNMLREYGFAVDELDSLNMHDLKDAADYGSTVDRISEKFFMATGLTKWTNFMRGLALNVAIDHISQHINSTDPDSVRRMEELGITAADVAVWNQHQRRGFGTEGFTPEDVVKGNSPVNAAQLESIRKVTGAVNRMVNEIVVNPNAAVKPLWRSDERLALIAQLGSFMYGFTSRVLGRVWYEINRDGATTWQRAAPALALTMMVPLAALGLELKEILQYDVPAMLGAKTKSPYESMNGFEYMRTVLARSGVAGIAQMGFDAYDTASYGRSPYMALLGPTASQFSAAMTDFAQSQHKAATTWNQIFLPAVPVLSSIPGLRNSLKVDYE